MTLSSEEELLYRSRLLRLSAPVGKETLTNRTIHSNLLDMVDFLPDSFADLLFLDPPYNLTKTFKSTHFKRQSLEEYEEWLASWMPRLFRTLKPTASVYICGDWRSSSAIHRIAEEHLIVRNRITWEREKGRGAQTNWKNCSEDIWFCTVSQRYTFNLDAVKLRRRVIAPYTHAGQPKDWKHSKEGRYRHTSPSNLWTDLTIPFWSMAENTEHPTQKPEKLLAKIILASSNPGDIILDPFLGSGTTSVVAKKLDRSYVGIEMDEHYCCLAEKRLALAEHDRSVQGYEDGVFRERNSS